MNISLPGAAIGTGLMIWCLTLLFRRKKAFNTASLSGKHVVITGASSGIGLALAKQALEEGAFVTLVARNINKLEKSVKSLLSEVKLSNSDNILTKVADVGDYAAISQVIEEAHAWRPIDMLVCNAGLTRGGFLEDLTVEDLDTVVKTNLLGSVYPVHAALPLMKQRSKSHPTSIVFIGSLASLCWLYGNGIYTATKYAVKGMAECLRLEVAPYNMRVHLVCPGFVESAFLDDACKSKELQEGMKVASLYDRKHAQTPEEVAAINV